ncbi:MAG: hypothetical protein V4721_10565 [Bacteroidota bacterium]
MEIQTLPKIYKFVPIKEVDFDTLENFESYLCTAYDINDETPLGPEPPHCEVYLKWYKQAGIFIDPNENNWDKMEIVSILMPFAPVMSTDEIRDMVKDVLYRKSDSEVNVWDNSLLIDALVGVIVL